MLPSVMHNSRKSVISCKEESIVMSDENKELLEWIEALAKGILLGCSIGAIVGWFGIIHITKAVALGGLCGCLAAINFKQRKRDGE